MGNFYRLTVVVVLILQLIWFFAPWELAYDSDSIGALLWSSVDAVFEISLLVVLSNTLMLIYTCVYIGLLLFNFWARRVYLLLVLLGGLAIPLYGIAVQSGYEGLLGYFITLGDGVILTMSYLTSISEKFMERKIVNVV